MKSQIALNDRRLLYLRQARPSRQGPSAPPGTRCLAKHSSHHSAQKANSPPVGAVFPSAQSAPATAAHWERMAGRPRTWRNVQRKTCKRHTRICRKCRGRPHRRRPIDRRIKHRSAHHRKLGNGKMAVDVCSPIVAETECSSQLPRPRTAKRLNQPEAECDTQSWRAVWATCTGISYDSPSLATLQTEQKSGAGAPHSKTRSREGQNPPKFECWNLAFRLSGGNVVLFRPFRADVSLCSLSQGVALG